MDRIRLDLRLVQLGLAESREQAQRLIGAGQVMLEGRVADKPGRLVPADAPLAVRQRPRFVSRGGEKLEAAISEFGIPIEGRICLDIGASTGGFTDCLLQHGASRVYAVDVGRGLLHPRLAGDPRVVVMDGVNARYLERSLFPHPPSLVTVDVSFISLRLILPAVWRVITAPGDVITLIKPQFEAGRDRVGRGGVVRDEETRAEVIRGLRAFGETLGLVWCGLCNSPLLGPAGNVEYLAWWRRP